MFKGEGIRVKKDNLNKEEDRMFCHKIVLDVQSETGEIEQTNEYYIEGFFHQNQKGITINFVFIDNLTEINHFKEKFTLAKKQISILSELAVQAVHEIRNPLSSIKGFAQLIQESLDDEDDRKEYINIIVKEIERLNKLVKEVFNLTRVKEIKESCEDIHKIIEDIVPLCNMYSKMSKKQAKIKIIKKFCSDFPLIPVDKEQMKQVFLNLINNAIEAMENKGEIVITTEKAGDCGIIKIEDTGCGIDEKDLSKVFTPFYTTKEEGTGLGLCIVKRIIENHNGSIHVESTKGKGSVFTIRLPVR